MEENLNFRYGYGHQLTHKPENKSRPSRLGLRNTGTGGEIVEVQGGHIVRSTGRKDRHSKVCTAKGPRDRRVRLSAHTAIQFYDVQDRLGYDRPSKAVDWLIKKAKAAIDELEELPPWKPVVNLERNPNLENVNFYKGRELSDLEEHPDEEIGNHEMGSDQNPAFLSQSFDSVKSFFPAGGSVTPVGSNVHQDLKLSLQSFQDPITHQGNSVFFDGSGWPETGAGGFNGSVFNNPPATAFLQPLFGRPTNSQLLNYISQRGPLQSSTSPPVRAWVDPLPFAGGGIDQHETLGFHFHHPGSVPGFSESGNGFSGFHVPARFRGDEEEHDGLSDKPSSGSSDSRH